MNFQEFWERIPAGWGLLLRRMRHVIYNGPKFRKEFTQERSFYENVLRGILSVFRNYQEP